jgi:hypothetical protein
MASAHDFPQPGDDRPSAESARRKVLDQHLELRRLLRAGLTHVHGASVDRPSPAALRELVGLVRGIFVQHLADEEALIVPFLEDDLPLGPLRVAALRDEHARQRAELEALCAWPVGDDAGQLATRFGDLAAELIADIEHEERDLLTPEVIRDDCIVVDQFGG